jgi:hypothetical protein
MPHPFLREAGDVTEEAENLGFPRVTLSAGVSPYSER